MSCDDVMRLHDVADLSHEKIKPADAGGLKYVGLEHIDPHSLILSGYGYAEDVTSNKSTFRMGDILFGKLGAEYRKMVIAPFDGICSTDIWVVRAKELVDQTFLFYWMASDKFLKSAIRGSEGSVMPRVKWDFVKRFEVPVTDRNEQISIGQVLQSLDKKILLNRKMFNTLEDIGCALFKSWFINFDPVTAKIQMTSGQRGGSGFDKVFPGELQESAIGKIPSGWGVSSVFDCATYINGAAYKRMNFSREKDALPVIKIAELKNGIGPNTKFTNTDLGNQYLLNSGDILFSWSGSPETSIDTFLWAGGRGWLNQHIFKVLPKEKYSREFCYFMLKHLNTTFIEIAKDKQTTGLGHVTKGDLRRLKVVEPADNVLQAFQSIVSPVFDRMEGNLVNTQILSETRDTLLSKFISGDLHVKNSECKR